MRGNKVVAISGGIGSGKSVVCRILTALGFPVYDCDSRAKMLMDNSNTIKESLKSRITPNAVDVCGNIDRKSIASVVFKDSEKLSELNSIVHGAVRDDIICWLKKLSGLTTFIETAILYQSGIDKLVDEVWEVTAPIDVRIARVCLRNNISKEEVEHRIKAQDISVDMPHENSKIILNDNRHSLLLQIEDLLK